MAFPINASLLDAMVLAIVNNEDTYGYKITQDIRGAMEVSESTLYPVLRRLLKENDLETYDKEFQGRNRRYYRTTSKGKATLQLYLEEWKLHKQKIDAVLNHESVITQEEEILTPEVIETDNATESTDNTLQINSGAPIADGFERDDSVPAAADDSGEKNDEQI